MWYKGYLHYHTSFRYSIEQRITSESLIEDLRKLGASFVFCAGDHGDIGGNNYWGLDVRQFEDYSKFCLSAGKESGIIFFIPTPEIHLMMVNGINKLQGYHDVEICSPEEVIEL